MCCFESVSMLVLEADGLKKKRKESRHEYEYCSN